MRTWIRLKRLGLKFRAFDSFTMGCLLLARFFFLLVLAAHAQLPLATTVTATLGVSEGALFDAVTDESITEILVSAKNFQLSPRAWSIFNETNPYRLTRDLLVRSDVQPIGQLDFMFLDSKVLIASGVTVTFQNLVLRNIRKLGGFSLDFFVGEENSTIIMRNVVRAKMVCNPIGAAVQSARSFANLSGYPNNSVSVVSGVCILASDWSDTVCYQDSIFFQDFAFLVKNTDPDAGYSRPGYILYMHNTTRVCDYYITYECINTFGGDACIAELLNRVYNGTQGFAWTPGAIAGVAVSASVVTCILVLCCYYRKRVLRCLIRLGRKSLQEKESHSSASIIDKTGTPSILVGSSNDQGKAGAAQTVRLGVLLGSGSFGRVYRGRWHGTDVAVKIISCTPDELVKVLKEAEVMMQLHHPNIVRAYQCSVWDPSAQRRALQAGKTVSTPSTQNPQPRLSMGSSRPTSSSAALHTSSTGRHRGSSSTTGTGRQAQKNSVVVNIMPEIVLHQRPGSAAAAAARASLAERGLAGPGSRTVSSSGTATNSGPSAGSAAGRSGTLAATGATSVSAASGSTSSSETARRLLSRVLHPVAQHQQQQHEQWLHQQQGPAAPSTRSWSHEGYMYPQRLANTPLSSATQTAAGSSLGGYSQPALASTKDNVAGLISGASQMHLAPVVSSQEAHSAPLVQLPGAFFSVAPAELAASTAPSGVTSSDVSVLLPLARGVPAGSTTAAHAAGPSVVPPTTAALSSSHSSGPGAVAEGKDGSPWWHVRSTQQQLQPVGGTGAGTGSRTATHNTSSSSGVDPAATTAGTALTSGSHAQQQQQEAGSSAAAAGIMEIQPATGWWRRKRGSSAGGSGSSSKEQPGVTTGSSNVARENPVAPSGPYVPDPVGQAGQSSDEDERKEVQVWLVLELCTGGTLKDAVTLGSLKPDGRLEMAKLLCRLLDAANGMSYLHSKGILHGDLKAGNVLLQNSVHGTYGQVAKISDFGLAATLMDGATHRSTASMGTITHMAPEVLKSGRMSTAADVYSFGVMMWEVYTGRQAHSGLHYGAVVERVVVRGERPPIPDNMPEEYRMLMKKCWDAESGKRPTFEQITSALEILLDNLTSDSDGRISEGNAENRSTSSSSSRLQELLDSCGKQQPFGRCTGSGAAAVATPVSGGAGISANVQVGQAPADSAGKMSCSLSSTHSGGLSCAGASGAGTPGPAVTAQDLDWPAVYKSQQLTQQLAAGRGLNLIGRVPSDNMSSSGGGVQGSRGGYVGWSSSLGSGSLGSGAPVTPQLQRQLNQQQGQLRGQGTPASSIQQQEMGGSQLVQDF